MINSLVKKAVSEFNWYVHNVSTNRAKAIRYAEQVYDHALECGYITELQHKKLCLTLPFETYLR